MKALLTLAIFWTFAVAAWACPFCSPVEADLFSELQEAQAVVIVSKVDAQKFKILKVLKGQAPVGKVVLAGEARGKASKGSSLLLTTAGPATLPYWSDSPRHLTPADLSFVSKALPMARAQKTQQWDFAAANLEQGSPEVATAAYSLLAAAPLTEVQKRAKTVGTAKLLNWVKSGKIPEERRALYLLMAYPALTSADAPWLKGLLFDPKLAPVSPLLGPYVVAYLQAAGAAGLPEVEKKFLAASLPASRTLAVTRALALVGHRSSVPALKNAVKACFLREINHPQRGPFAIAPLAVFKDYKGAPAIEKLAKDNADTTWIKVAVIRYFRSFSTPEAKAALDRLAKSDANLVSRTSDAYKVSDLGIE